MKYGSFYRNCLAAVMLACITITTAAQQADTDRMAWFGDARLGIFIHWGIYSVNGIDESWSFYNEQISYDDYMNGAKLATMHCASRRRRWQQSLAHRGERGVSRKTIRAGKAGLLPRKPVVNARSRNLFCAGAVGAQRAPGLPCSLCVPEGQSNCRARAHRAARTRTRAGGPESL